MLVSGGKVCFPLSSMNLILQSTVSKH
uniref:Uncharacterized protein n=1 Tax=Rhizophora mucronata TaxID=61149 RepID=A0A2P2LCS1_RHIMU